MTSSAPSEEVTFESTASGRLRNSLDQFCERGILVLVLAALVFGPLAIGAVRPLEFSVIQGVTIAILGLWAVRVWIAPRYRLFWPPICWAVVAVALYAATRSHFAEMPHIARAELYQVLVYTALFFAIINNLNRREFPTSIAIALIVLAVGLSIYGIYQFATQDPHIWKFTKPPGYSSRGSGTYINPNHLAGFLEMVLPLALAFTLMGRFNHASKALIGYATLVIAVGIGVSMSRGGIVSVALAVVTMLLVLLFQRDYRLPAALTLLLLAILGGVFASQLPKKLEQRFTKAIAEHDGKDARAAYWNAAWQVYQEDVVWGVGPGHFDQKFWPYRPSGPGRPEYVHNDYLQTLCEWGAAGLGLIGSAVVLLFLGIKKTWRIVRPDPHEMGSKTSTKAAFLLGGAFGLLAILFHSVFDFNMHIPANAILVVVLFALLSSQVRFATERFWRNPRLVGKLFLTLTVLAAMVTLGLRASQQARAGLALDRAENQKLSADAQLAALREAAQIEPDNFNTAYALGERLRLQSWEGREGYQVEAEEAMNWFRRAMELNPYDPYCPLRYGMCLDWLERYEVATPYFKRACTLDPRGEYPAMMEGWHYIQMEDYPAAKDALERSWRIRWSPAAYTYLQMVKIKLAQAAKKTN